MLLPDGLEPGTPLADVLPLSEQVLEIETGFNRPDLTSVYGIAREVSAVCRVELAPPPGADPARGGDEPVDVRIEDLEGCPRYIGRLFRDVRVGESPAWLQARLHRGRHAPDLERRRHHELRHARARQPAARLRRRQARRRPDRRPARESGRGADDARRHAAEARAVRPDDRRRRALGRDRRDHGRRGQRGHVRDDGRPARGRELRPADDPAQLAPAAAALGGLDSLGEGRRSGARRAGGRLRDAAPRRAGRRALDRLDRREGRAAGPAGRPPPAGARRRAARARDAGRRAAGDARVARLRGRRRSHGRPCRAGVRAT